MTLMAKMKISSLDTTEIEQVWESMSDSQKEIFRLGFHIGHKLGLQEAQEAKNPELPNKGEANG